MGTRKYLGLVLAHILVALASQDSQVPLEPQPSSSESPHEYHVAPCPSYPELECGIFQVPLDWHDPSAGNGQIRFARYPAASSDIRKGTIFLHTGVSKVGRLSTPERTLAFQAGHLYKRTGGEYDIVMWTPRGRGILPGITIPGPLICYDSVEEMRSYYDDMFYGQLFYEPSWNDDLDWTHVQNATDAHYFHIAQKEAVSRCLEDERDGSELMKYVGTAATVRDLVAMADTFQGPNTPINLWGALEGSLAGSYLLKMFPERAGRILLDDPVDPVAYTELQGYLRWQADIASANSTVSALEDRCTRANTPASDCSFDSNPLRNDMAFVSVTLGSLRIELMGWRNDPAVEVQNVRLHEFFDTVRKDVDFMNNRQDFPEYAESLTRYRERGPNALGLGDMPIICGDALYEHAPDDEALREAAEAALVESLYSVPLIISSAFPSWRYLCHLWPVRAVERVSFETPYEPQPNQEVLVLLRKLDPLNHLRISEEATRNIWPNAAVATGLDFGQHMFDHNNCNLDLIARFFSDGTIPDEASPCQNADERRHHKHAARGH